MFCLSLGLCLALCLQAWPSKGRAQSEAALDAAQPVLVLDAPSPRAAPAKMSPVLRAAGTVKVAQTFLATFASFTPNAPPWRHAYGHGPSEAFWARTLPSNKEQQLYVDPQYAGSGDAPLGLNPFSLKGGVLSITGRKAPTRVLNRLNGYRYLSGMLSTEGQFEQQYGFFEARMKLPKGQGLWPAFWLKRAVRLAPEGGPSWPPEIDVMEYLGHENGIYHVTSHWDVSPNNKRSGLSLPIKAPTRRFHNYGVLWTKDHTVFYLDRRPVAHIETKPNHHVEMHMILNLALGGIWPGPVADKVLPAKLEIDWVSAWQLSGK